MIPEDRMLPHGFESETYANLEAYESLASDQDVLHIGDKIDRSRFNNYYERWEKAGWTVGNLIMWHKTGIGYSVFPILRRRETDDG